MYKLDVSKRVEPFLSPSLKQKNFHNSLDQWIIHTPCAFMLLHCTRVTSISTGLLKLTFLLYFLLDLQDLQN